MKRLIFLLILLIMLFSACSCAAPQQAPVEVPDTEPTAKATPEPASEPTPEPTQEPTPEPTPLTYNQEAYDSEGNFIFPDESEIAVKAEDIEQGENSLEEKIPLYDHVSLRMGNGFHYSVLNHDIFKTHSVVYHLLQYILEAYPSEAIRQMPDGRCYIMYNTTDGARMFFFFDSIDNTSLLRGHIIYMYKTLEYANFGDIEIGDTIEDVIAIDKAAKDAVEVWNTVHESGVKNYTDAGSPIASVHLLKDGILRYTYERSGEQGSYEYTITNIEYREDFKLGIAERENSIIDDSTLVFNYSIAEVDYVD